MFWGEFLQPLAALDRCTLNKGAFAFKMVRGAPKWPLKGGSRLIEVAATAGLTVYPFFLKKKAGITRAAVDGTPSQIPAFIFTYNLYLGVKVTQNVAQYLLHNVTCEV